MSCPIPPSPISQVTFLYFLCTHECTQTRHAWVRVCMWESLVCTIIDPIVCVPRQLLTKHSMGQPPGLLVPALAIPQITHFFTSAPYCSGPPPSPSGSLNHSPLPSVSPQISSVWIWNDFSKMQVCSCHCPWEKVPDLYQSLIMSSMLWPHRLSRVW